MKQVVTLGLVLALSILIHLPEPLLAQDTAAQEVAATVSVQDAAICQEVVDRIAAKGGEAIACQVDVTKRAQVKASAAYRNAGILQGLHLLPHGVVKFTFGLAGFFLDRQFEFFEKNMTQLL